MKTKGAQKRDTSAKALAPTSTRRRITFRFQLDIGRDNVEFFSQLQQWLASQRIWKRYAMDGLRLFYDLKQGSTAVLLELFPNIREMLAVGQGDDGLKDEIAQLRRLILEQRDAIPTQRPNELVMQSGNALPLTPSTGKQIAAPAFEMPTFDDDDDLPTLKLSTNTSINSAQNLVNCVFGLTH